MSELLPSDAREAFESHDAYTITDDAATVTTTVFDGEVTVEETEPEWAHSYVVTVTVPTLAAAVADDVGAAVESGWLDTFERRLEDAPKATRASVDLETFDVETRVGEVVVTYAFTSGTPAQAAAIAKAFVEYVEGTYVEGIVPGYDYQPPVSKLLQQAQSGGSDGERGGTPL
ncbi:DUF5813 family protein [Halapricum salinum]|uniref:YbjN domain-containing protein n=1 Tax=Halapricum salinum TaxID=1457250 RepID=A0A4D6HA53_9EURY|nr:DUF5813 family protein [Halapricum salinum]QCC50401.1 hypothetical protein DV733_03745 [Halapricum salinum]